MQMIRKHLSGHNSDSTQWRYGNSGWKNSLNIVTRVDFKLSSDCSQLLKINVFGRGEDGNEWIIALFQRFTGKSHKVRDVSSLLLPISMIVCTWVCRRAVALFKKIKIFTSLHCGLTTFEVRRRVAFSITSLRSCFSCLTSSYRPRQHVLQYGEPAFIKELPPKSMQNLRPSAGSGKRLR